MADPTLMIGYDDLLTEVRTYLGLNPSLSTSETTVCERIIKKGLSSFYRAYHWTFSHPTSTITVGTAITGTVVGVPSYSSSTELSTITIATGIAEQKMVGESFSFDTSGENYTVRSITSTTVLVVEGDASGEASGDTFSMQVAAYDLPDNFGHIESGMLYHRPDDNYAPVKLITESDIHRMRQSVYTGVPRRAAIRVKSSDLTAMQKKEIIFYPTPGAEYVLTYSYTMLNDMLASGEYPLGDSTHRGTIIEACLAAAEQQEDDELGMHTKLFSAALAQSVAIDGENEPSMIGYNADRSDAFGEYPEYNKAERELSHYYSSQDMPSYG